MVLSAYASAVHLGAFILSVYGVAEFAHEVTLHIAAKDMWWQRNRQ
ncbi:hypothetical protein BcepSauron_249 [Burkholderia phage BcepSauron]|uniref:Uncharacterized protein n=1 Tax=Burkholderia phage BcepSauron TaxID=2530033 RepID=A0A482MLU0_9CAUD|nr:hypothetical protein H1O17_gp249 [Burkholderia phage BcepSauron]QBQ74629.1 hypothetical protein BcepSauron_249 [Burkholderia phage BcepSauron]